MTLTWTRDQGLEGEVTDGRTGTLFSDDAAAVIHKASRCLPRAGQVEAGLLAQSALASDVEQVAEQ